MKSVWRPINIALVASALVAGYRSMSPQNFRFPNNGPVPCIAMLVLLPLFALGAVLYSKHHWDEENKILARRFSLQRPSWERNPINWWGDPLQALFISACCVAATAVGGSLRHPAVGSAEFWMLVFYASCAAGLLTGLGLAYRFFGKYIAAATN